MKYLRSLLIVGGIVGAFYLGKYLYLKPGVSVGQEAPHFEAQLIDGKPFHLTQLRGDYVLINFWASWCGPCRRENPELSALYRDFQYHESQEGEGFEILAIALEERPERAQKAIAMDGLSWPYNIATSDAFKSDLARLYGIKSIPAMILIDPKGEILAVNPALEEVRRRLEELFDRS